MTFRWPHVGFGEVLRHVRDREGVVWRVVRDGGMATCADATSVISVGIAELARVRGPLEELGPPPADGRECGWLGCGRAECETVCAGVPADRVLPPVSYELPDFSPGSSHLHGCAADAASCRPCDSGCIHALFDVAQDLDRRVAAQRVVIDRRAPLSPFRVGDVIVADAGAAEVWASNSRIIRHEAETPLRGHDEDGDCCRRARLGLPQRSELCVCEEPRPAVGEGQPVPVGAYIRCLGCRRLIEP